MYSCSDKTGDSIIDFIRYLLLSIVVIGVSIPTFACGASIAVEDAFLQTDTHEFMMHEFITGAITVSNQGQKTTTIFITLNACSTSGDIIPVGTDTISLPVDGRKRTSITFSPQEMGCIPGEYIFLATALPSDAVDKSAEGDLAFFNQREIFNII